MDVVQAHGVPDAFRNLFKNRFQLIHFYDLGGERINGGHVWEVQHFMDVVQVRDFDWYSCWFRTIGDCFPPFLRWNLCVTYLNARSASHAEVCGLQIVFVFKWARTLSGSELKGVTDNTRRPCLISPIRYWYCLVLWYFLLWFSMSVACMTLRIPHLIHPWIDSFLRFRRKRRLVGVVAIKLMVVVAPWRCNGSVDYIVLRFWFRYAKRKASPLIISSLSTNNTVISKNGTQRVPQIKYKYSTFFFFCIYYIIYIFFFSYIYIFFFCMTPPQICEQSISDLEWGGRKSWVGWWLRGVISSVKGVPFLWLYSDLYLIESPIISLIW